LNGFRRGLPPPTDGDRAVERPAPTLTISLPFRDEDFLAVFAAYHEALWPVVLVSWGLAVSVLIGLARHRAWSRVAYHAVFFTKINPAAWAFSVLFVVEAADLLWLVVNEQAHRSAWSCSTR
jgi:hypothetical protein